MKKIYSLITGLSFAATLFAQAPQKMSYQAVIRSSNNELVTSSTIGMRISILQGSVFGTSVYVETQTPITNANGLATLEIGTGTVITGTFSTIDWANGPYFIKTESDPTGGTAYNIAGTSELLSVPYALYAKSAGSVSSAGSFTHYLGEQFEGGVIFNLWKDNAGVEHGLIVDKTNLSINQVWSNITAVAIGPNAQISWDGLSNSNAIISQFDHFNSAALLCINSTNGGQSDWYLPSIDELNLLWHARFYVNKTLSAIGGATFLPFEGANYWTSNESNINGTGVFALNFANGNIFMDGKSSTNYVRAIRTF